MPKNERLFTVSDATMIEHADTVKVSLPDDISDFTSFDSTISTEYPNQISGAIDAVLAVKSDQVIIDEQVEKTQNLNEAMGQCTNAFRTIAYFARKVFKDNKAVQNQFGLNDIEKVRNNQPRMILFMEELAETAQKYQADLVAAGCNEAVITALPEKAAALRTANTEQEKFKKDRGLYTQERVEKLNELYRLMVPISEIAQIIYADDPARLARYLLPKPKGSNDAPDDLITS